MSFRKLSPLEVVRLAAENGLEAIEWGGDVHVPHGRIDVAVEVGQMTRDAGLAVACYGSYYRCGQGGPAPEEVVSTATALGAPLIRVWAGQKSSEEANEKEFGAVHQALQEFAARAEAAGIGVTVEFHPNTVADTAASAIRLLSGCPNAGVNWQPDPRDSLEMRKESLELVLPFLTNLHVFNWSREGDETVRRPLAAAREEWIDYFGIGARDRFALLEFMPNNTPEELAAEAATLRGWLSLSKP